MTRLFISRQINYNCNLKAFADDRSDIAEMHEFVGKNVENVLGKKEKKKLYFQVSFRECFNCEIDCSRNKPPPLFYAPRIERSGVYSFTVVRLSVCPSFRLSVCLSAQFQRENLTFSHYT